MRSLSLFCVIAVLELAGARAAAADSGAVILANSRQALADLALHVEGSAELLQRANGVLVFPDLVKLGFAVGGQYGEGVLLIADEPVAYYATAGATFGLQLGAQRKSEVIVFLSEQALQKFRNSRGWEVGVDASVALVKFVENSGIDSLTRQHSVVGFIFSNKGLMANLTLEGNRVAPISR